MTDAALDFVVEQIDDRGLLTAYVGLVAESATDRTLQAAMNDVHERVLAFANEVIDDLEAHGHRLSLQRELLILAAGVERRNRRQDGRRGRWERSRIVPADQAERSPELRCCLSGGIQCLAL